MRGKSVLISTVALAGAVIAIVSSAYVSQASYHEKNQAVADVPKTGAGRSMQCVMIMPPSGTDPKDLPVPESSGAKLTARYCAQCHNLPNPKMHSADNWPETATRMFARISIMSSRMRNAGIPARIETPSEKEQKTILAYLQENSLKSMPIHELPLPESHGAVFFKKTCSQCHDLPDINLHAAGEWPGVIERMRSNMSEMGKRVITKNEAEVIREYLASNGRL